jgi:adenylate cyclase, class 2
MTALRVGPLGSSMRPEIEIKLALHDPRATLQRLTELGFRRVAPRSFERNTLFDFPDRRLRNTDCLLRLRLERRRSRLTFKGPRDNHDRFKTRLEIETDVKDGQEAERILGALGLCGVFRYEKFRTLYRRRGDPEHAEVVYDETPIGTYLELEGPRRWIDKVARALGFERNSYVTASYGRLYFEWCQMQGGEPGDMIFPPSRGKGKAKPE